MSQTSFPFSLEQTKRLVFALDSAVGRLVNVAGEIGIREPRGDVWFTLLKQKLLPQISEESLMVVAVVGGTNTGKSLLFNQLAGENASSVDARAAGTKHPVCILPLPRKSGDGTQKQQSPEDLIRRYFKDFTPVQWSGAEQPLESSDTNLLFWRVGSNVPERLMLLDTPDIDSDAEVNWERASAIRQAADILFAVVTPQKYNDAAVRRFFRDATAAGKQTILMWNMVDIEQDASDLPQWTEQFSRETGTQPHAVYVAPHNR
ncbi:MAG: 50S ribosome-binding GTPase, partial [Planctomycetaceae bacterium]|nr:50S ribosome-binding GTPase [Planctomycetaceae bacterium]